MLAHYLFFQLLMSLISVPTILLHVSSQPLWSKFSGASRGSSDSDDVQSSSNRKSAGSNVYGLLGNINPTTGESTAQFNIPNEAVSQYDGQKTSGQAGSRRSSQFRQPTLLEVCLAIKDVWGSRSPNENYFQLVCDIQILKKLREMRANYPQIVDDDTAIFSGRSLAGSEDIAGRSTFTFGGSHTNKGGYSLNEQTSKVQNLNMNKGGQAVGGSVNSPNVDHTHESIMGRSKDKGTNYQFGGGHVNKGGYSWNPQLSIVHNLNMNKGGKAVAGGENSPNAGGGDGGGGGGDDSDGDDLEERKKKKAKKGKKDKDDQKSPGDNKEPPGDKQTSADSSEEQAPVQQGPGKPGPGKPGPGKPGPGKPGPGQKGPGQQASPGEPDTEMVKKLSQDINIYLDRGPAPGGDSSEKHRRGKKKKHDSQSDESDEKPSRKKQPPPGSQQQLPPPGSQQQVPPFQQQQQVPPFQQQQQQPPPAFGNAVPGQQPNAYPAGSNQYPQQIPPGQNFPPNQQQQQQPQQQQGFGGGQQQPPQFPQFPQFPGLLPGQQNPQQQTDGQKGIKASYKAEFGGLFNLFHPIKIGLDLSGRSLPGKKSDDVTTREESIIDDLDKLMGDEVITNKGQYLGADEPSVRRINGR